MLEETNPINQHAILGENPYSQPEQSEKPEKYDYSQVQLPENYCYNEELLNEFNTLAAKYDLSQNSANELMSLAVKLTQLMGNNYSETLAQQNRQKVEGGFEKTHLKSNEIYCRPKNWNNQRC